MTPHRYRIVVALDLSEYSEIVLEHALDQAGHHDAPDLHFVTVIDSERGVDEVKAKLGAAVLEGLDGFDGCDWHARLHVRVGKAAAEIANLAAELRAHLIVVGRFGLHHATGRLGSVASRVIEAAPCPTLVVGLVDQSPDSIPQCEDCVSVRAESDGEIWFCAAHARPERGGFTTLVDGTMLTGGGLMW